MNEHPFDLTSKMNRLVAGLLEKRIIPFLGAGISRQATYTGSKQNLKDLADTGSMIRRVAEAIYHNYKFPEPSRAEWSRSCTVGKYKLMN